MSKKEEATEVQALSTDDKDAFNSHMRVFMRIEEDMKDFLEGAKEAGFTKSDFTFAMAVVDAEKEAKAKATINRRVLIASFVGSDVRPDPQLDLFPTTPEIGPAGFAPFTADEVSNY